MRDWGDYRGHGDQGIWGARMDNSGRLRETVRDWGDYRDHGDQEQGWTTVGDRGGT